MALQARWPVKAVIANDRFYCIMVSLHRMVLLLQAMAKYLEQTLAMGTRKATAVQASGNTSIGLVVKKYWNKMVQVYTVVQQVQSEV